MRVLPISLAADDPKHVMAKAIRSISVVERRVALATLLKNVQCCLEKYRDRRLSHFPRRTAHPFAKGVKGWPPAEAHVT
jgi:hypothetical protein